LQPDVLDWAGDWWRNPVCWFNSTGNKPADPQGWLSGKMRLEGWFCPAMTHEVEISKVAM